MQTDFEAMGGAYTHVGDYLLPDVEAPESPQIGLWGERRRKYLQEHKKATYTAMLLPNILSKRLISFTSVHSKAAASITEAAVVCGDD